MKERDVSIDVLRWLALTGIILVHIGPSPFWNQLRSFDVPMMVFLSSVCFHVSRDYKSYCVRRFERLVIPVWIFLTVYFSVRYVFWGIVPPPVSVIRDYTLMTDWYVWIIRIFLLMALLAPLVNRVVCRVGKWFPYLFIGGLLINEVLGYVSSLHFHIYTHYAVMTFSYALVYSYGIYLARIQTNNKAIIIGGGKLYNIHCDSVILNVGNGRVSIDEHTQVSPAAVLSKLCAVLYLRVMGVPAALGARLGAVARLAVMHVYRLAQLMDLFMAYPGDGVNQVSHAAQCDVTLRYGLCNCSLGLVRTNAAGYIALR